MKIRHDLKWNDHIDYLYDKVAKRLYTLRVVKRAGVAGSNIINIYKCSVRIDQYAVPAWQDIPAYLSVKLESIQKRVLKIIFPDYSYDEALYMSFSGLESFEKRRFAISRRFISAWRLIVMKLLLHHMILDLAMKKSFRPYTRTKRANDSITFKFLD